MKILSIIVTFNGIKWYNQCFNSLLKSTVKTDIFVVDNSPNDLSYQYIKENFPTIILRKSTKNIGFGQANNIGLKYALKHNYDFVFLLNQDAWINTDNTLERITCVAQQHPDYGLFSPIHMYAGGKRLTTGLKQHLLKYPVSNNDFFSDLYKGNELNDIYEVGYINACSWLIPISTLKIIGGFDPIFFMYGEDDNFLNRVKFHNLKIGIITHSEICHDIEFRGDDYAHEYNNKKKDRIVELCNINISYSYSKLLVRTFFSLTKCLYVNKVKRKSIVSNFIIITKYRRKILYSRKNNLKVKENWL